MERNDLELNDLKLCKFLKKELENNGLSFISQETQEKIEDTILLDLPDDEPIKNFNHWPEGIDPKEFRHFVLNTYGFSILNKIKREDDFIEIWEGLLSSAIKCLKGKDEADVDFKEAYDDEYGRQDYGVEELADYLRKFSGFEGLLYGSSKYYRDHIYHTLKVWLLGYMLIKDHLKYEIFMDCKDKLREQKLKADSSETIKPKFNSEEIDSIWCIIALTHDLGYPLEKLPKINELIRNVLPYFGVTNLQDFLFNFPTENQFSYEYLLKFTSSRIERNEKQSSTEVPDGLNEKRYTTHLQSKYYIKFLNSFENYDHGIISAVLLMRHLVFFLESDFEYTNSKNEYFDLRDAKQFQIRREILRSIASHTCDNIYHISLNTFPFLLIICDEMQEWGRPRFQGIVSQDKSPRGERSCICHNAS